jgi:hypothetical protein
LLSFCWILSLKKLQFFKISFNSLDRIVSAIWFYLKSLMWNIFMKPTQDRTVQETNILTNWFVHIVKFIWSLYEQCQTPFFKKHCYFSYLFSLLSYLSQIDFDSTIKDIIILTADIFQNENKVYLFSNSLWKPQKTSLLLYSFHQLFQPFSSSDASVIVHFLVSLITSLLITQSLRKQCASYLNLLQN